MIKSHGLVCPSSTKDQQFGKTPNDAKVLNLIKMSCLYYFNDFHSSGTGEDPNALLPLL
jgi:hypothetical protein